MRSCSGLLLCCLLFFTVQSRAQKGEDPLLSDQDNYPHENKVGTGFKFGAHMFITPDEIIHPTGQIDFDYYVSNGVSFQGNFGAGPNFIHFNMGALGILSWMAESDVILNDGAGLILLLSAFESPSFHIPLASGAEINPYLSVLSFNISWNDIVSNVYGYGTGGIRYNMFMNSALAISVFIEGNYYYAEELMRPSFGGALGWRF